MSEAELPIYRPWYFVKKVPPEKIGKQARIFHQLSTQGKNYLCNDLPKHKLTWVFLYGDTPEDAICLSKESPVVVKCSGYFSDTINAQNELEIYNNDDWFLYRFKVDGEPHDDTEVLTNIWIFLVHEQTVHACFDLKIDHLSPLDKERFSLKHRTLEERLEYLIRNANPEIFTKYNLFTFRVDHLMDRRKAIERQHIDLCLTVDFFNIEQNLNYAELYTTKTTKTWRTPEKIYFNEESRYVPPFSYLQQKIASKTEKDWLKIFPKFYFIAPYGISGTDYAQIAHLYRKDYLHQWSDSFTSSPNEKCFYSGRMFTDLKQLTHRGWYRFTHPLIFLTSQIFDEDFISKLKDNTKFFHSVDFNLHGKTEEIYIHEGIRALGGDTFIKRKIPHKDIKTINFRPYLDAFKLQESAFKNFYWEYQLSHTKKDDASVLFFTHTHMILYYPTLKKWYGRGDNSCNQLTSESKEFYYDWIQLYPPREIRTAIVTSFFNYYEMRWEGNTYWQVDDDKLYAQGSNYYGQCGQPVRNRPDTSSLDIAIGLDYTPPAKDVEDKLGEIAYRIKLEESRKKRDLSPQKEELANVQYSEDYKEFLALLEELNYLRNKMDIIRSTILGELRDYDGDNEIMLKLYNATLEDTQTKLRIAKIISYCLKKYGNLSEAPGA